MTQDKDIVERLLNICENDDHERGCQGREYDCTCGFDERTFVTAKEAAQTIAALRAERDAARKDNMQAARQNRERAEAAEAKVKQLEAQIAARGEK